ncbi:hypothetical protein JKF63_03544 [Porcisia hertigi]|uniref:Uncharacterized protein n=1 Tax=Porcisia hertigi TaxID=2761500 RepID=A0A836L699_9TRYP|nr:hypothetical protein JKF63_03544 [Porcisia hertigi]
MPFDTVGGLPPMPTHARGATVYYPRQPRVHMPTHAPPQREPVAVAATESSSPPPSVESPGWYAGDSGEGEGRLSTVPMRASSPKALVPFATNDAPPPNPWRQRTTLGELEARQRRDPYGVAQLRPALQVAREYVGNVSDFSKPLLEAYHTAQELAQVTTADTWPLRRSRYLQWLRHAAATALEAQKHRMHPSCEPSEADSNLGPDSGRRPFPKTTDRSDLDSVRTSTFSSCTTPLPRLPSSSLGTSPATMTEPDVRHTDAGASMRRRMDSAGGALPPLSGANPNELAVRHLFRTARMAAASAADGSAATEPPCPAPADEIGSSLSEQSMCDSPRRRSLSCPVGVTAETPTSGGAGAVLCGQEGAGRASADGAIAEVFIDRAAPRVVVPGNSESGGDDDDDDDCSSTPNSATAPPFEYDLGGVLRHRMHRTVALFTASSKHTLDQPPVTTKTHTFLGKARLSTSATTSAPLVKAAVPEVQSLTAGDGEACLAPLVSAASQNAARALQRLLYEEEYERGVLYQLALQSSPARWYSTLLPGGNEGIRFRLIAPPDMFGDEAIRERLRSATRRAAKAIAQPRRDLIAADEARLHAAGRVCDTSSSADPSKCVDHCVGFMVECAAGEKARMFTEWGSLHANLSAQLQLFTEEMEQRRVLLGEFLSCTYPAPCACLSLDLEVLALSAVSLEPTVRPACWYASVVLGRHRDILQQELLECYKAERNGLYGLYKVVFFALYCYDKLVTEEARCFERMLHYHEFCLRVAASRVHEQVLPRSEGSPPDGAVAPRALPSDTTARISGRRALQWVSPESVLLPRTGAGVLCRRDSRMWRLRQRRLRHCALTDSPFFSYLVYTDLLSTAAAEEKVRKMISDAQTTEHTDLRQHMIAEEALARLCESESRCRGGISMGQDEGRASICAGPFTEICQLHSTKALAAQAGTGAQTPEAVRQEFVATAVAEKTAVATGEMMQYQAIARNVWQHLLALLVADRSAVQSAATSREWLNRQQHVSLFNSEHRLRNGIALLEEVDARARITEALKASLKKARKLEALRLREETASALSRAQDARDAQETAGRARLRQGEWPGNPRRRPSANKQADAVDHSTLAMALEEDFEAFLPSSWK